MNKTKTWIKEHAVLTVGIVIILATMLISSILLASIGPRPIAVEDDSMTVAEYQYMENINEIILIYIDTVDIMEQITVATVDDTISYYDAAILFESAVSVFSLLEISLNDMVVPYDYREYHEHIENAVRYTEEAASLMAYGYMYNDAYLMADAVSTVRLATSEFEKATVILANF